MIRCSMIWGSFLGGLLVAATGAAQQMAPPYGVYGNPTYIPPNGWQTEPAHGPHRGWEQPGLPYDAELLPPLRDRGFFYDFDSALDLSIREEIRGMRFKLEYLNWSVSSPDRTLFGAPLANVPNPNEQFDVFLPDFTVPLPPRIDSAFVPDTENLGDFNKQDGFKGTFSFPVWHGSVESSFWILEDEQIRFDATNLVRPDPALGGFPFPLFDDRPGFIATSLLTNGGLGNLVILYDEYQATYKNRVWSGDVNYYFRLETTPYPWVVEPSLGYKYVNYNEYFNQTGLFDNRLNIDGLTGRLATPIISNINSTAINNLHLTQVGMRFKWESPWVTFAAEPKALLGVNNYSTAVYTNNLRDSNLDPVQDDGEVRTKLTSSRFIPGFDLGVNASIPVSANANLTIGYNLMMLDGVARGPQAIYYNDTGPTNPPGVVAQGSDDTLVIQGLTVGMEFHFK